RRFTDHRLIVLLPAAEPLCDERRPERTVGRVRPAAAEHRGQRRVLLRRCDDLFLVHRVGRRLGGGEKTRAEGDAHAPSDSAATTPRASPMPPAAMTGTGAIASTTRGTSTIVATPPATWPPASAPCAMTASTPASTARRASA